jgi:PAS domain S-box-containing protein
MEAKTAVATDTSNFRKMIESITDYEVVRLDPEGRICSWHPGAQRLTGYRADEIIGHPLAVFYPPEDVAAGQPERELETVRQEGRCESEGWRVRKDGTRFWASVVLSPIRDHDGLICGYVDVTRDVTERREQELDLRGAREMLEAITEYEVIRLDAEGNVQSWNPGAARLTQYAADEVLGHPVSMFYTQADAESELVKRELAAAARDSRFETEGWRVRKDGTRFWASVVLSPIRDQDGRIEGYVKVARDLTERREQEQILQQQREAILELSTPVIQVWDRILVLPIIGVLDSMRASRLTERLLEQISRDVAEVVILDVSGLPMIDTGVAQHLLKTVEAARLMGTTSVLSGIRPDTAQTMVHLGIDLGRLHSRRTLREALQLALRLARSGSGDIKANGGSSAAGADNHG